MPLLQTGEFGAAPPIESPEVIPWEQLDRLHLLGYHLTNENDLLAIAYTQIPDQFYQLLRVDLGYRRIIYLSHKRIYAQYAATDRYELSGTLLINPRVSVDQGVSYFVNFEGCGSIRQATLKMAVARPSQVALESFVWRPEFSSPAHITDLAYGKAAAFLVHEHTHLEGQDATRTPDFLLDPFYPLPPSIGGRVLTYDGREIQEEIGRVRKSHLGWLVHRGGSLVVTDLRGNTRYPFTREPYSRQDRLKPNIFSLK